MGHDGLSFDSALFALGERVVIQLSQGVTLDVRHSKLAVAKPNYRFVTRGRMLLIDDLNIFEK